MDSQLPAVFDYLATIYNANWTWRWSATPYMPDEKSESILGHKLAMMQWWYHLSRVCINLNECINTLRVYEMIMNHDVGEILLGDVSIIRQLKGEGKDKKIVERLALVNMTQKLETNARNAVLSDFDSFEESIENVMDLNVLLAKFLDTLQADHFILINGINLPENSELISTIVHKRFLTYSSVFRQALDRQSLGKASDEVGEITNYMLEKWSEVGVTIN